MLFKVINSLNLIENEIYYTFPKEAIIYCMEYSNSTHTLGCLSNPKGNSGILIKINNQKDLNLFITEKLKDQKYIVVLDNDLSLDVSFMRRFVLFPSLNESVTGVVILQPKRGDKRKKCKNAFECGFGKEEFAYLWPFPIIIVRALHIFQERILACIEKTKKDHMCSLEIKYPQHKNVNWENCKVHKAKYHFGDIVKSEANICELYTGTNHYFGIFEKPINGKYIDKTFIIIYSRQDTVSMFEDASYGSTRVIPSVSIIMNMLHTFYKSTPMQQNQILKNMDFYLLIALVDNDSNGNAGTIMLYEDLKSGNIRFGEYVFRLKNFLYSVEIDKFVSDKPYIYLLGEESTFNVFKSIMNNLPKKRFAKVGLKVYINYNNIDLKSVLHPKMKTLLLRDHITETTRDYPASFQDQYTTDKVKKKLETLAWQINKLFFNIDTNSSSNFGLDFYNCMVENIECSLLYDYLTVSERIYLEAMANPFQCQFSSPVHLKGEFVSARMSDIIYRIAVCNFGEKVPNKNGLECFRYDLPVDMYNKRTCFRLPYIYKNRNFVVNKTTLDEKNNTKTEILYQFQPILAENHYTRLFIVVDPEVEIAIVVTGTILMVLSFVGVIFLKGISINSVFAKKFTTESFENTL